MKCSREWRKFFKTRALDPSLIEAYVSYAEQLNAKKIPVIFEPEHLSLLLGIKYEVLLSMVHSSENFYRVFQIPKRAGGFRKITAPYLSLSLCQKWIYKNILLQQKANYCVHGFIPGRSIISNAKQHLGQKEFLKLDLKNFFDSIPINWVINFFHELGYSKSVSFCLASLCCYQNHLAQGSPTSPYLTNLLLRSLDFRLSRYAKKHELIYTRNADDITFSGTNISIKLKKYIESIIVDYKLEVNKAKTRILKKDSKKIVTGIVISGDKLQVPRFFKRELKKEYFFIKKHGLLNHMAHQKIRDPHYLASIRGKFHYWKQVEPDNKYVENALEFLQQLY